MDNRELFAVAGRPIFQSRSPALFNAAFAADSYPGLYLRLVAPSAGEALSLFRGLGLRGLNVTAPFKSEMAKLVDELDPEAAKIGAVNTILAEGSRLKGFNTDALGAVNALKEKGIELPGQRYIVLGAGGAGRAAARGLVNEGAFVIIVNRTAGKAARAAADVGGQAARVDELPNLLGATDGLIVAIAGSGTPLDPAVLPENLVVLDARYPESPFAAAASQKGCRVLIGEDWLLHQALPAYRLFTGREAPAAAMAEALREGGSPRKKANVALIGFSGSGKSAVGAELAALLGLRFADVDALIEEREGASVAEIFERRGEETFRESERAVLRNLSRKRGWVLACGGGAVLDPEHRLLLRENATVVWLQASLASSLARIAPDSRPLLAGSLPDASVRELWNARFFKYAETADLVVGAEGPVRDVVARIHEEIGPSF